MIIISDGNCTSWCHQLLVGETVCPTAEHCLLLCRLSHWTGLERQEGGGGEREHHGRQHQEELEWQGHWQDQDQVRRFNLSSLLFNCSDMERLGLSGGSVAMLMPKKRCWSLTPAATKRSLRSSGVSVDSNGLTFSLAATTTAGRSWGPHGAHKPDIMRSLRKSLVANLRLRFISGDQTDSKWILR